MRGDGRFSQRWSQITNILYCISYASTQSSYEAVQLRINIDVNSLCKSIDYICNNTMAEIHLHQSSSSCSEDSGAKVRIIVKNRWILVCINFTDIDRIICIMRVQIYVPAERKLSM